MLLGIGHSYSDATFATCGDTVDIGTMTGWNQLDPLTGGLIVSRVSGSIQWKPESSLPQQVIGQYLFMTSVCLHHYVRLS